MFEELKYKLTHTLIEVIRQNADTLTMEKAMADIKLQIDNYNDLARKDPTPHTVIEVIYMLIDEFMAELVEDQPVSCGIGCAHCCKMNVSATPMEVNYIVDYCAKNNIPIDLEKLRLQAGIPAEEFAFAFGFNRCVFLSNDNKCKIYPVRPAACRKHVAVTPRALCDVRSNPTARAGSPIAYNIEVIIAAMLNLAGQHDGRLPSMLLLSLNKQNK